MKKIFVYGTLMSGCKNNWIMKQIGGKFIRFAATRNEFTLLDLGAFPGIVERGENEVQGELWEISDDNLFYLDRLEFTPYMYKRVEITLDDDDKVETYVYVYDTDGEEIESGDWKDHVFSLN